MKLKAGSNFTKGKKYTNVFIEECLLVKNFLMKKNF